jgi:hypothetical protein
VNLTTGLPLPINASISNPND